MRTKLAFLQNALDEPSADIIAQMASLDSTIDTITENSVMYTSALKEYKDKKQRLLTAPAATDPTVMLTTDIVCRILIHLDPKAIFQAQLHTLSKRWHDMIEDNRAVMLYMAVVPHVRYTPSRKWQSPREMPVTTMDTGLFGSHKTDAMEEWKRKVVFVDDMKEESDVQRWIQYNQMVSVSGGKNIKYHTLPSYYYGPSVVSCGMVKGASFDRHGCAVLTTKEVFVFLNNELRYTVVLPAGVVGKPVAVAFESGIQAEAMDVVNLRDTLTKTGQTDPDTRNEYTYSKIQQLARTEAQTNQALVINRQAIEDAYERAEEKINDLLRRKIGGKELEEARIGKKELQVKLRASKGKSEWDAVHSWFRYNVIKEGVLKKVEASGVVRVHVCYYHNEGEGPSKKVNICTSEPGVPTPTEWCWRWRAPWSGNKLSKDNFLLTTNGNDVLTLSYTNTSGDAKRRLASCIQRMIDPQNSRWSTMGFEYISNYIIHDMVFVPGVGYYALTSKGLYLQRHEKRGWIKLTNTKTSATRLTVLRNGRVAATRRMCDPIHVA